MQTERRVVPANTRDQVRGVIRAMIIEGELGASARVEEVEIAELLGVSRTPVREALIALEHEGLVSSRPNRGFSVTPIDAAMVVEAFPILGALESAALRLAGAKVQPAADELDDLVDRLSRAEEKTAQTALDDAFHDLLTRDCGNARLLAMLSIERTRARRFDGFKDRGIADRKRTCADHARIARAIRKGAIDEASDALIKHWQSGIGIVLKWMREQG